MILENPHILIAIVAAVVNFAWSSLNLRLMRSMEKKFVTREQFHAEQKVRTILHQSVVERMERAGI